MEQKSLSLKQQTLETNYELARLKKSFTLDKEEFRMGIKSKAQLEVSEDEYNYKVKNAELQREGLRHDSAVTIIRKDEPIWSGSVRSMNGPQSVWAIW